MGSLIDLGCHPSALIEALPGAILVIVLFVLLAGLGSLIGGAKRWAPADLISGWGVVTCVFTLGGILLPGSLPYCAGIVGAACITAMVRYNYRKKRAPWHAWFLIAMASQVWILALINHAGISGWDDIAQWTPNALFLWHHHGFPNADLPLSYSNRPTYPYALAYLDYIVSLLHGAFVIQAGAMINWLLLASFGWALTEFEQTRRSVPQRLMRLAFALLLVTLFNPGFNPSFSITGQADTATAVAVGFLGLLLLRLHAALHAKERGVVRALMWQIALASIVLSLLRDMNLILLGLLVLGALLAAWKDKNLGSALRALAPAVGFGVVFYALWRGYAGHAMAQEKTIAVLPFSEWHWAMLPDMLRAMGAEMLKKNGFYVLMLGASGFGIWSFFRRKMDKFGALGVVAAVVFIGSIGFIITVFMGASLFTERNIRNAMSFYRYGTHIGLLGVTMLWFLYERYVEPRLKAKAIWPAAIIGFALLPLAYIIKPAWLAPQPTHALCENRATGDDIARHLPPRSHIIVLDSGGNGFETFIVNFELAIDDLKAGGERHMVAYGDGFEPEKLPALLDRVKTDKNINAVLLTQPSKELKQFFHAKGDQQRYLLLRQGEGWRQINLAPAE